MVTPRTILKKTLTYALPLSLLWGAFAPIAHAGPNDGMGFVCTPSPTAPFTLNTVSDCIGKASTVGVRPAMELGMNRSILLATDKGTDNVWGLMQLRAATDTAKPTISFLDKNYQEVIWLQTHDYLNSTERHQHFSIEAADSTGRKQSRLGVGYGKDNVDVTVNQADLKINRNAGMTNGNIFFTGAGQGGSIKHASSLKIYPNYATNATNMLAVSLMDGKRMTLDVGGSEMLYVADSLKVEGRLKIAQNKLFTSPQNGTFEYDGNHLYFTKGTERIQLDGGASGMKRVEVNDDNYVVQPGDALVAYTSISRDRRVTLPDPAASKDRVIVIKDESGNANREQIRIDGQVDGRSMEIDEAYGKLEVYSNGKAWFTK